MINWHCQQFGLAVEIEQFWSAAGVLFYVQCVNAVRNAVSKFDYPSTEMFSGTCHQYISQRYARYGLEGLIARY